MSSKKNSQRGRPIRLAGGDYYTTGSLAERLGVSERLIRLRVHDGTIQAIRIGQLSWLISATQAQAYEDVRTIPEK